jgi:hypothetical protein
MFRENRVGCIALVVCGLVWSCGDQAGREGNADGGASGAGGNASAQVAGNGSAGNGGAGVKSASGGTAAMQRSGAAGTSAGPATFKRVWTEIIERKGCSSSYCHGAGAGMLMMDNPVHAYANLVSTSASGPKCGASEKPRVKPGDPSMSLVLEKISGPAPECGDPMPIGVRFDPDCLVPDNPAVCTEQSEVDLVRDWIADGALND